MGRPGIQGKWVLALSLTYDDKRTQIEVLMLPVSSRIINVNYTQFAALPFLIMQNATAI